MDKNKLSYYASYVAIACGILILAIRISIKTVSLMNTFMGILFIVIGIAGLRSFRNK
ncbi:hypothetical protein [Emticicia sp. SJ17W-69]|uniref:hypothetical protein n=1 Tax=Emticicia sp. SJ17W-69 TaxID=3421657 RepID=UPI003EBCC74D